jgi:hypothetical protein
MALVEEREDAVAGLPLRHVAADGGDGARAVGAGDDGQAEGEDVFSLKRGGLMVGWDKVGIEKGRRKVKYLRDEQVAVVEGCPLHLDEHIVGTELRDGAILVDEAVKSIAGALDEPLFLGGGERHVG